MSRRARQNLRTSFFHVIVQGINKESIFKKDQYKEKYLKLIEDKMQEYDLDILAYAIMNTHAHLLIHIEKIKMLSEFMKKINEEFANYYNYKENRVGYVFRDRFLSEPIYNQVYLLRCISYIHNNPVKAHIVSNCGDYKFSSYNDYLGKTGFVNDEVLELVFGTKQLDAEEFKQIHNGVTYYFSEYENRVDENMKEIIEELQKRYNKDWQKMIKKMKIIEEIATEIKERVNISNYRLAKYLKISRYRLEQILKKKNFLQNRPVPNCKKFCINIEKEESLRYNCHNSNTLILNFFDFNSFKSKEEKMLIILIILLILFLITGFISGNFLFNLALNPKSSKSIIVNRTIDETEEQARIDNTKWLNENASEVFIQNKKIKLCGYEIQNKKESKVWVIGAHGYTETACSMVGVAKQFLNYGYNVLLPDLRAHGKSEGKYIGMGWLDRLDLIKWINYLIEKYGHIKIILYGISMGAATVMMASGENLPSNVRVVIEDCGYTSVWDEFADKLKTIFHIPKFPAMYNANFITKIRAGFSLKKASCIKQIKKSKIPTLFIHGDKDKFVPFYMLDQLYNIASCKKEKLVIKNAGHTDAQTIEPQKYWSTVRKFIKRYL